MFKYIVGALVSSTLISYANTLGTYDGGSLDNRCYACIEASQHFCVESGECNTASGDACVTGTSTILKNDCLNNPNYVSGLCSSLNSMNDVTDAGFSPSPGKGCKGIIRTGKGATFRTTNANFKFYLSLEEIDLDTTDSASLTLTHNGDANAALHYSYYNSG